MITQMAPNLFGLPRMNYKNDIRHSETRVAITKLNSVKESFCNDFGADGKAIVGARGGWLHFESPSSAGILCATP